MANKRGKRKLNSKWANRISLLISAMYCIFTIINGINTKPTGEQALCYWGICCAIGTVLMYGFFALFIFKVEDREREEKAEEMEIAITRYLSGTDFKQVYFICKDKVSHIDMMNQILQKEGCEFYAKITESKKIYLMVKDKHNEEVYSTEIGNHVYFNAHFKFEK